MQAVVLVGGQGSRLRPLTTTTPKPLVPLANRPVLAHILAWLAAGGVTEVILATQYAAAAFQPFLERWQGIPVRAVEEPFPLGTAGAIRHVRAALHGPTVIVNGDNLTNLDLGVLAELHHTTGAQATIAVDTVSDPTGRGVVVCDARGRVSHFQEKPALGTALANTVNTGTYLIEPAILDRLADLEPAMWETDLFPALIAADVPVYAARLPHVWIDVGTPTGYLVAQAALLAGTLGRLPGQQLRTGVWVEANVNLDSAVQVSGAVTLGFGSQIAAGVTLTGPLMIGRETHLLPAAQVTRGAIWDGSLLEQGAQVIDSIVGYNCYIGAGAMISGTLLGDGCVLAPGTVLPVGTSLAPGTHI